MTNPTGGSDPYRTTPAPGEPATGDYASEGTPSSDYVAGDYPAGAGIGVTSTETTATWPPTDGSDTGTSSSTRDVAKGEAANVKDTAVDAGKNVAATAKGEAANVVQETKQQAQSLLSTVSSEVRDQGRNQQQRIAGAAHSLSKELGGMASSTDESGPLTDLARQGSQKLGEIGHWLENSEPSDVLEEVKRFARRRPVAFLGICTLAGIVVGRLARGAVAANTSLDTPDSGTSGTPALTAQTYPSNYESTYTSTYPTSYPTTGAPLGTESKPMSVDDLPATYSDTPSTYPAAQPVYDDPARPDLTR